MIFLKNRTKQFWNSLLIFTSVLITILMLREYIEDILLKNNNTSFVVHTLVKLSANLILILFSYYLIKKNQLSTLAGLEKTKLTKVGLLIFPFLFLVGLNVLLMDELNSDNLISN